MGARCRVVCFCGAIAFCLLAVHAYTYSECYTVEVSLATLGSVTTPWYCTIRLPDGLCTYQPSNNYPEMRFYIDTSTRDLVASLAQAVASRIDTDVCKLSFGRGVAAGGGVRVVITLKGKRITALFTYLDEDTYLSVVESGLVTLYQVVDRAVRKKHVRPMQ